MRKFFLASAAVAVYALPMSAKAADLPLKAAPVMAVPEATGYIEVYGGWASTREGTTSVARECGTCDSFSDIFSSSIKGSVLGGAARGNYWLTPAVSMQMDVQAEGISYNYGGSSFASGTYSSLDYLIGGHVNWRDSNRGLVGAFAGIGDANGVRHAVFGAEGQWYWNQFTLYGQVGYGTTLHSTNGGSFSNGEGVDMDAWFIRGTGRYYLTPNLRLEATGMYADGNINLASSGCSSCGFSAGFSTLLWEAKAEWKLDNSPFAFFFKYRGSQTDYNLSATGLFCCSSDSTFTGDAKVTDNQFLVGARMYLGERSLVWNDRQGATLDIISPLSVQSGPLYSPPSFGPILSASDIRLKRDVRLITTLDNGLKIYSFKYIWSETKYVGVMAQDLLANQGWREAVVTSPNGYYAVDYTMLGLKMTTLEDWTARGIAAIDLRRQVSTVVPTELQSAL